MQPQELANKIAKILSDKSASDINIIEVSDMTVITDYFIIASGRATTQVKALAEHVDDTLSKEGLEPRRREGISEGKWVAMDYGDVIVHIFLKETREFYHLDRLWVNGDNVTVIE